MNRRITIYPDSATLVEAIADRLTRALMDLRSTQESASVVLTGGSVAIRAYTALAAHPLCHAVDWGSVDLWWGDERFLPEGHPDRNETQARTALLDSLPLDPRRVHPIPAASRPLAPSSEEELREAASTAARYEEELTANGFTAAGTGDGAHRPFFDILLLGVGEDGHVASIFPGHPLVSPGAVVSAVRDSPKPPPTRVTLTWPALDSAREVWVLVSGEGKAAAVRAAIGDDPSTAHSTGGPEELGAAGVGRDLAGSRLPVTQVAGTRRTLWLIDRAAAGLP